MPATFTIIQRKKVMKKKNNSGSHEVVVLPTFKCDKDELAILTALISVYDESKFSESTASIARDFEESPGIFFMELMNAEETDEDVILFIKTDTSVSLCDIVGNDYWNSLSDDQRVAVGPCIMRMIEKDWLKAEFPAVGSSKPKRKASKK
jgi:hypothetical protein